MNLEDAGAAPNALPDNYFDLGLRLLEAGEYAEAVAMFERAIKLGLGDLAAVYLCRAEAQSALGQWDAAEKQRQPGAGDRALSGRRLSRPRPDPPGAARA